MHIWPKPVGLADGRCACHKWRWEKWDLIGKNAETKNRFVKICRKIFPATNKPYAMNTVIENNTKDQQLLPKYENIFVLAYSSHMSVLVLSNSVWQQIINPDS